MRHLGLLLCALCACATTQPTQRQTLMNSGPEWLRAGGEDVRLAGRRVVFVAGFLNELIPGYFTDNVEVTRELGAQTSVLLPPSRGSLQDDVALIERELATSGAPAVLFGHSKGGAAVLLTVLQHPEWVLEGRVEAVIVLQGAIGGSPLADSLAKVKPLRGPGMESLTTDTAQKTFSDALVALRERLSDDDWQRLFARVFYVRSAHDDTTLAAELSVTHLALAKHGPNDGLLPQGQMRLIHGVDLGVLDADHAALTVSSFLATSTRAERRAFTLALYREVGRHVGW